MRLGKAPLWKSTFHSSYRCCRYITVASAPVPSTASEAVASFKDQVFNIDQPSILHSGLHSPTEKLLARSKWFSREAAKLPFSGYVLDFEGWVFPYELVISTPEQRQSFEEFIAWLKNTGDNMDGIIAELLASLTQEGTRSPNLFTQLDAPLRLLVAAIQFNSLRKSDHIQLYIAQSSLSELPEKLRDDLETPEVVLRAGRGDIYSSSIWLGTQPTYTPLHRDPNPNLFCQLFGIKSVKLMHPSMGQALFYKVQAKIGQQGNSHVRTTDMMQGAEREALHHAVWESPDEQERIYEVEVHPGDALFIPKGWWHSIKSIGPGGQLNASANWWFR